MAFRAAAEKLTMVESHVSFTLVSWVVILDNMVGIALYLQTRVFFWKLRISPVSIRLPCLISESVPKKRIVPKWSKFLGRLQLSKIHY